MSRIGILGGSFDPPHAGHAMMAREARDRANLDTLLFVPAGEQWLKPAGAVASPDHRLAMTHLLAGSVQPSAVSDMEIRRGGPTYTVDTLTELVAASPPGTDYIFILGEDTLADLPRWHMPRQLVTLCRFVALPRADDADARRPDVMAAYDALPGLRERVTILDDAARMDISSSSVRRILQAGEDAGGLVPNPVLKYIAAHGLYGNWTGEGSTPPTS